MRKTWMRRTLLQIGATALLASPVLAQDEAKTETKPEKQVEQRVEKRVTVTTVKDDEAGEGKPMNIKSTVQIVVVGEDGKVIKKSLSQAADAGGGKQAIGYALEDGAIRITLPEVAERIINLNADVLGEGKHKIIQLRASNGDDGEASADAKAVGKSQVMEVEILGEVLHELDQEIAASLEGLHEELEQLGEDQPEKLLEKIREAIRESMPEASKAKMLRLGKAAVVVGQPLQAGDKGPKTFKVQIAGDGESGNTTKMTVIANGEAKVVEGVKVIEGAKIIEGGKVFEGVEILEGKGKPEGGKAMRWMVKPAGEATNAAILEKLEKVLTELETLKADVEALKQGK